MLADKHLTRRILHPRVIRGTSGTDIDELSSPVSQTLSCEGRFKRCEKLIYKTKRRTCVDIFVSPWNVVVYARHLQDRKQKNLLIMFASFYRFSCPFVLPCHWFHHLNIPRQYTAAFYLLRLGHNRMSAHALYLSLNDLSYCTRHGFFG